MAMGIRLGALAQYGIGLPLGLAQFATRLVDIEKFMGNPQNPSRNVLLWLRAACDCLSPCFFNEKDLICLSG